MIIINCFLGLKQFIKKIPPRTSEENFIDVFNLFFRNVPLGASTRTLSRKFMKNSFPTAVSRIIITFLINAKVGLVEEV